MALGGNVEAVMQLLELMDESEDWHMGDFDVLGDDASDSDSDSEGEFENVQAQLSRMHTHGSRGYKPYGLGNKQAMSTHEKILRSIEEDDRLFYVRGLGSEASMDELELACVSLLSLVMEPNLDEELVDDGVVGGRRKKAHRPRRPYTVTCALRQTDWFERSFTWENEQFRALYRMSKPTFWAIVKILERNPLFTSTGRRKQRPVSYQLGVFLLRYGNLGSAAKYPMMLTSIGEGTVLLYSRRVMRGIREFGLRCVGWPTPARKEEIKEWFKEKCGLDGIIGALDGTLCELANKPRIAGDAYISRKGTASVTVQAITDHEGRFIAFQSGLPGSKNDTYVWQTSAIYINRNKHFAPGEFLLADGGKYHDQDIWTRRVTHKLIGYPLSPFVLIPFDRRERAVDGRRKRAFNRRISKARVIIEGTFGRLKARFPSLHRLGAVEDMRDLYRAIEAMMILHNMCYDLHDREDGLTDELTQLQIDNGEDVYDYVGQESDMEDEDEEEYTLGQRDLLEQGRIFRNRCLDQLCPA